MTPMSDYLRLRSGSIHVHELGPRAVGELLHEIGQRFGATPEILDLLDDWRALNPETLRALGGDQFPRQLRAVPK